LRTLQGLTLFTFPLLLAVSPPEPPPGRTFADEIAAFTPGTAKAALIVCRDRQFAAGGSDLAVQIDGEVVTWLDRGEHMEIEIEPGKHLLTASLVKKWYDSFPWYAELWPKDSASGPSSQAGALTPFDNALLHMNPDSVPKALQPQREALLATTLVNLFTKRSHHDGVLTQDQKRYLWAEGRSREEVEATLDRLLSSLKKDRSSFVAVIPPSQFKEARGQAATELTAEAGQAFYFILDFTPRAHGPWVALSREASLERCRDFHVASNAKYGPGWKIGSRFLKDRQ